MNAYDRVQHFIADESRSLKTLKGSQSDQAAAERVTNTLKGARQFLRQATSAVQGVRTGNRHIDDPARALALVLRGAQRDLDKLIVAAQDHARSGQPGELAAALLADEIDRRMQTWRV